MIDPLIHYCLQGSFALLFALSAAEKYHDLESFRTTISNYRLIPESLIPAIAVIVIAVEITTATMLLTKLYYWAAWSGTALLTGYALAIWINLLRGRSHIDCGCLGSHGEGISYLHVLRNLLMISALAICLLPSAARDIIWLDYLVVASCIASMTLIYGTATLLLASHLNQRSWWQ